MKEKDFLIELRQVLGDVLNNLSDEEGYLSEEEQKEYNKMLDDFFKESTDIQIFDMEDK